MAYYCGQEIVTAMGAKGLANNFKHFFLNDQENGRQGISTFANEQAMREIYLRAFEGGITCDGALAIMTSYNRIGCTYMAADSAVQFDLLRKEWGFLGYTMTDYIQAGEYSSTPDAILGGTDIFGGNDRVTEIKQLILRNKSTSGELVERMQEAAHHILWTYAHTSMMNGLTSNTVLEDVTYWWQNAILAIQIAFGVLTAASLGLYVWTEYFRADRKEKVC